MIKSGKKIVLGIDAAWTPKGSSGVALIEADGHRARLVAAAPSYQQFIELADERPVDWRRIPHDPPKMDLILSAAEKFSKRAPDIVAVDMPMSRARITKRREADNAISRQFGAKWASTHSPSKVRPGPHGARLQQSIESKGFVLATREHRWSESRALVEIYPHCALIQLFRAEKRLEYKASKMSTYWPAIATDERKRNLREVWRTIANGLDAEISGSRNCLGEIEKAQASLKTTEDVIDAIVAAWVGACFLREKTSPYGDSDAAIWVPIEDWS